MQLHFCTENESPLCLVVGVMQLHFCILLLSNKFNIFNTALITFVTPLACLNLTI